MSISHAQSSTQLSFTVSKLIFTTLIITPLISLKSRFISKFTMSKQEKALYDEMRKNLVFCMTQDSRIVINTVSSNIEER